MIYCQFEVWFYIKKSFYIYSIYNLSIYVSEFPLTIPFCRTREQQQTAANSSLFVLYGFFSVDFSLETCNHMQINCISAKSSQWHEFLAATSACNLQPQLFVLLFFSTFRWSWGKFLNYFRSWQCRQSLTTRRLLSTF